MKTLNLVMAIVYTIIYALMILSSIFDNDIEVAFGCILLSGPIVVNWITYSKLK